MKKNIKHIISVTVFIILLCLCGKILRYILIDDTNSYTRVTFHEMYAQDNIDVLFVGSSHCYRSFVPDILDDELGMNTFNAGSSSQAMDGSYMVIKEAARYNDIKHIYLEVYYKLGFDVRKNRTQMTQTYIISDYLRPSVDKALYLLNASNKEQYVNSFIIARRNWEKLYDFGYIKNLISKKNTDAYKKYDYTYITYDNEWYVGKGYVANNDVVKDWNYFSSSGWNSIHLEDFSDDWFDSLSDIIEFCDKNNIKLTLIGAPMSDFCLAGNGNYDEYITLVKNLIKDTDVDYYDFNLCKEEYFPNTSEVFMDADHVNCYGAERFSRSLALLENGKVSAEEMFYDSFDEKMNDLELGILGVSYDEEEGIRHCKIVSTPTENMEYQIEFLPEKGRSYSIQDYSENRYFDIPSTATGTIRIKYRMENDFGVECCREITVEESDE